MMTYEGYVPTVWYEPDDRLFHGYAEGDRHMIHFAGASVDELEQAFRDSVEDYLAWRRERGEEPRSPHDPKHLARVRDDARGVIEAAAAAAKQPVEKWVDDALHRAALETLRRAG